jgi:glutathione reductase (NADPH)
VRAIFPPVSASVGLQERAARSHGLAFRADHEDTFKLIFLTAWRRAIFRIQDFDDKETGRILGAHLLGPDPAETINILALAVRKRLTSTDLKDVIHAYPHSHRTFRT